MNRGERKEIQRVTALAASEEALPLKTGATSAPRRFSHAALTRLARIKCNGFSGGQIEKGWKRREGGEGGEDESLSDRVTERTVPIRTLPGR
ncbi:hypothetical protein EYF80_032214 [Liparis tanakae]|uniref:Uncharacterized protein n=1 Tax=Liparis tanakae TaxID=230148 RepID=A0A4Z2GY76_9TELE|nr:hypothetical protein EYF80_032214 [Liparis tanakae]